MNMNNVQSYSHNAYRIPVIRYVFYCLLCYFESPTTFYMYNTTRSVLSKHVGNDLYECVVNCDQS